MTEKKRTYGRSRGGVDLTEKAVEKMSARAEKGLDVETLVRRPGRPAMGSAPAGGLPVRFDPELREALDRRAEQEGVSAGEVVRRALRKYLRSA